MAEILKVENEFLEKFYRNELRTKIAKILEIWETKIGVKSSSIRILKMKTKWGSCNIKMAILLSTTNSQKNR